MHYILINLLKRLITSLFKQFFIKTTLIVLTLLLSNFNYAYTSQETTDPLLMIKQNFDIEFQKILTAPSSDTLINSTTKKNYLKKFLKSEKKLQEKYKQYLALEKKLNKPLTKNGNEIMLNIILLEPLKNLANSKSINPEICKQVKHENELNQITNIEITEKISNFINKICFQ